MGDAERVDADRLRGGEALAPRELERALEPRHRDVGRVAGDAELSQELERPPLGVRIADLGCDGVALLGVSRAPGRASPLRKSIAAAASSASARRAVRSGAAARAWSKRRCASWRSIRRSQNGPSATHKRSASPGARSSSVSSAARRFAASRSSRGELRSCSAKASAQRACRSSERGGLARLVEPLARVQANGLEQPVAALAGGALVGGHQRLLDETSRARRRCPDVELAAGAHALDRLELEAASEGREPTKQRPLVRLEQVVAPLQRRLERLLPCRRRVAAGAEHAEAVVESLRDRRRTERSQAAGGELERERQAVESKADAGNVHRVLLVEREAGRRRIGPLDEQPHGLVAEQVVRLERRSGSGMSSDGTRNTTSPGTRSGSRLVARIVSCGAERSSVSASPAVAASRCSQLSRTSSMRARREELDHGVDEPLPGQRPHVERGRDRARDEPGVRERSELDQSRTVRVRRLGGAGQLEREPRLAHAAASRRG